WFSVRSPVSASQRHFPLAPGCLPGLRGGADGGVHGLAAAEPLTSSFWPPSPLDGSPPKGLSDDGGFEEFVEFLASRSASSTVIACNRHRSSRRAPELSPSKKARFIAERLTGGLFDMPAKESDSRLPRQHFSPETAQSSQYTAPPRIRDCERFPPLLVLKHAIVDPEMAKMLVTIFNDQNQNFTSTLEAEIAKLPGIEKLAHKPQIRCGAVDESVAEFFSATRLVPSFSFVDPFGYKGLSLQIVNGVIKDWGCDCVFFFNYNRINSGISNPAVEPHINALFGQDRADKLRQQLRCKSPEEREALVLEELAQAIKEMGGKFVLPFKFKTASGTRTSHSLIFVSKHFKGYEIMKDIMANESSARDQDVPSFEYSPATAATPLLFSLARPYEALVSDLTATYSGSTLSMQEIYEDHSVDTPY